MANELILREALERSYNALKYQYETDKQRIMRMNNVGDRIATMHGLNMLASILKQNEDALFHEAKL